METKPFRTYYTTPAQHDLFKERFQVLNWAETYPAIFDQDDLKIARNQAKHGYHFYEWLAAVLLFHDDGHLSLVEQYQFRSHPLKQKKMSEFIPSEVIDYIKDHPEHGNIQCPDLLVYEPGYSEWFFC